MTNTNRTTPTTPIEMEAVDTNGNISTITVRVPVGSMDEPTSRGKDLLMLVENKENWKDATSVFNTDRLEDAEDLAYTLDWYLGGHEMETKEESWGKVYLVSSLGYYHYIGA